MSSNIELYHCNEEERINDFVSNDENLIISNHFDDDVWAGKGMYFWDNKGNANYWYGQKIKKNPEGKFKIAKAQVTYTEETIMDLLDFEIEEFCQEIIDEQIKKGVVSNKDPLGKKIDFVVSEIGFKVVRVSGYYKFTPQTKYLKRSKVSNRNKIIYCVKEGNFDIINKRKVLGDE